MHHSGRRAGWAGCFDLWDHVAGGTGLSISYARIIHPSAYFRLQIYSFSTFILLALPTALNSLLLAGQSPVRCDFFLVSSPWHTTRRAPEAVDLRDVLQELDARPTKPAELPTELTPFDSSPKATTAIKPIRLPASPHTTGSLNLDTVFLALKNQASTGSVMEEASAAVHLAHQVVALLLLQSMDADVEQAPII